MLHAHMEKARRGEEAAQEYLEGLGWTIREHNYHFGRGEIDLIGDDGDTLVFVEVKTRTSQMYGPPEYAITWGKQKQLRRVAEGYLYERRITDTPCRFDVITVEFRNGRPELNHVRNAFTFYDR